VFKFCSSHICGINEARHLKFRVLIDTEEYYRSTAKRECPESRDLIKFWEISDNISETVQDRDIVAMEDQ